MSKNLGNRTAIPPYVAIPYSMLTDKNLSGEALRLFAIIGRECYFSTPNSCKLLNAELSKLTGKGDRQITRLVNELEGLGYITSSVEKLMYDGKWNTHRTIRISAPFAELYRRKLKK